MIIEPTNPSPTPEERKAAAEEYLTEAMDRLREVLADRPDGIPFERLALQAIKHVEAECLNWKRAYGLLSREELSRATPKGLPHGGDRVIDVGETAVVDLAEERAPHSHRARPSPADHWPSAGDPRQGNETP